MRRKAVLVANGVLPDEAVPYLQKAVAECDLLIGVDGGTRHLTRLQLIPHVVSGDFDSLSEAQRASLAAQGVMVVHTPDQNFTDLDKALALAWQEFGVAQARVFGASAGRLDHVLSNLSAVVKHSGQMEVRMVDEAGETWRVDGEVTLTGADLPGRTLSLIALGPVEGITATGVRWPLTDELLAPGVRDGVSNEVTAEIVTVRRRSGELLVQLHHPAQG